MTLLVSPSSQKPSPEQPVKLRVSPLLSNRLPRSPGDCSRQAWCTPRNSALEAPAAKRVDPFLAKYLKEPHTNMHELYFRLLQKQSHIKSFDYYKQYLKLTTGNASPAIGKTQSRSRAESPLRNKILLRTDDADELLDQNMEDSGSSADLKATVTEEPTAASRRRPRSVTKLPVPGVKKIHPQVELQILSREFSECPTPVLIKLIARMLQSLINLNDRNVPASISNPMSENSGDLSPERKNKLLTRYHLRTPPAISIETYISRLVKFNNFTQANLLSTIYYIDLLSHNFQPYFTLNSWTVHRFLLVATMLAQKALEDFFYTNDHYAKVGGVALTELNCLELDFLNRVDWKVVPAKQILNNRSSIKHSKEVLDMYYWQLVSLMGKNVTEQNNIVYAFADPQNAASSRL